MCGTGGVAAQSKRCEFLVFTPPCVAARGGVWGPTVVSAAINDLSPRSVNDIQSLFILRLHIVTGFYQGTHKIHGDVCVTL